MQQPQYYKTVRASEPPKEEGIYMTKWKGVPAFTEKEFKDGEWQTRFENTGLMTHWLEPIPIPDAERLREALEKIAKWELPKSGKHWDDGSEMSYEAAYGSNGARDYIRSIAREALSNTSDGWVRVEDRLPKAEDADERGFVMTYKRDDRQWGWPTSQGVSKWKRVTPSTHTHWRPLPSPPQNK